MNLQSYIDRCHAANSRWWTNIETGERIDRNKGELIMLVISEIAEAMEGERKGLMDDKLPDRRMAEVEMADAAIRVFDYCGGFGYTLGDVSHKLDMEPGKNRGAMLAMLCMHLADALAFELDGHASSAAWVLSQFISGVRRYCEIHDYDLVGAIEAKMAFNATRADHTIEARRAAGGKKW